MSDDFIKSLQIGQPYKKKPWFGLWYGDGKTQKTGCAVYAPKPFFVGIDPGIAWIFSNKHTKELCHTFQDADNNLIIAKTIDQVFDMIKFVRAKGHDYGIKTIVIDGLKFFEDMTYLQTIADNPRADKDGNPCKTFEDYGLDRFDLTKPYWTRLIAGCRSCVDKGFNVLLIGHSALKTRTKDDGVQYKETVIDLPQWGSCNIPNLFHRECDFIYYLDSQVMTATSGKGGWAKQVATVSEQFTRIHTRATSLFYAGSRSANEGAIPDRYLFNSDTRQETITQLFEDLEK